jgi:hypothetical protein
VEETRERGPAHPIAVLDEIEIARTAFAVLDEQRERIKERINRGQALLRAVRANPAGA